MQVSSLNNVKIYNLSAGKSLPEWVSERKRRALVKGDVDLQRRIQLIQDFDMPTASNRIHVSPDGQYIMASGVYKPRVRCYDVNQLSMKFERCIDAEVEQFAILSDDYSKMVFLRCDRYVEFHSHHGYYYRTRIPKFGRDLVYHKSSCDLFLAGAGPEVYRLNLEQGRFLEPFKTSSSAVNVCRVNPVHQLLAFGTADGCVEGWDPRSRARVGALDVASAVCSASPNQHSPFEVSALRFRDGLVMAVGTSWGQLCLYDLRSNRPLMIKDHQYEEPIKQVLFHQDQDLVVSADRKQVKIWHELDGKNFTSIEPEASINDVTVYPNSGLVMMANEAPKMSVYYIPTLGTAPKWCSILDSLTEELEENPEPVVYDDYKFVTKQELEALGLSSLLGTPMLRAYMHGFFMDIRLYHKAKSFSQPFAHEEYRKKQIQKKLKEERTSRVALQKLPKVNRNLAQRLIDENSTKSSTKTTGGELMKDSRFQTLFSNPDFQVDEESEEFKRLHPVLSKKTHADTELR